LHPRCFNENNCKLKLTLAGLRILDKVLDKIHTYFKMNAQESIIACKFSPEFKSIVNYCCTQ
jgi:hypothetical protein